MTGSALAKVVPAEIAPIEELKGWAELAVKAQIIPSNMNAYQAMAIVQAGKEMGLQPLQSLRSMSFIKGRLTMSVQLQLAMAKNRGVKMDDPEEGDGYCIATLHRGTETQTCKYTLEMAKKAGLLEKSRSGEPTNWDKYEPQMLRWRAIGDALRLIAPDLTMNLLSPEEAASIEPLAPLPVESLKELAPAPARPAPTTPASEPSKAAPAAATPAPKGEMDEHTMRDHLAMILSEIADIRNAATTPPGKFTAGDILVGYTANKDGKYGKQKVNDVAFTMDKKSGGTWSPLTAIFSKAKKDLETMKKDAEDEVAFG